MVGWMSRRAAVVTGVSRRRGFRADIDKLFHGLWRGFVAHLTGGRGVVGSKGLLSVWLYPRRALPLSFLLPCEAQVKRPRFFAAPMRVAILG